MRSGLLTILSCPGDWPDGRLQFSPLDPPVQLPDDGPIDLAMQRKWRGARFFLQIRARAATGSGVGTSSRRQRDLDEGGRGEHASFTGAFAGMAAFDTSGDAITADFTRFDYIAMDT